MIVILAVLIASVSTEASPTQYDGLTVALHCDSTAVTMGARVVFHVSLAFDSSKASPSTRILNRYSARYEFLFVNDETAASFQRLPYDAGMPIARSPGDLVRMKHGERLSLDDVAVHLLAENGDQIPPGKYSVRVVYTNSGGDGTEAYFDSTQHYRQRHYDGPWTSWTGRIQSEPVSIAIRPASESITEVTVPTGLEVDTTVIAGRIGWRPDGTDSTISVKERPGFALGNRWQLNAVADGVIISDFPRGLGTPPESGWLFLAPDVSARLRFAKHAELILSMDIFETSVQPGHMWMPERGDFRVLWQGQARYTFQSK